MSTLVSSRPKPLSIVGIILSVYSTTDTFAPKRLYTCPNSKPITPPPITIRCLGTSFSLRASVEVITRSLSRVIKGKEAGLEPVAIIVYLASISCSVASAAVIFIWVGDTKEPTPVKTSTLFLSIKNFTPAQVCSTTAALRAIIFSKLRVTSPESSMPCASKCLRVSS